MAAEGLLAPLLAKWGYLTGRSQESIHAMLRARQRERWLIGFIGLFGLLLVLAVWQARRATRESKRATRSALELRGSERRFHDLFENVQLLGVISDRQGSITFANRFTRQVTGWPRADLIGQRQLQFFPKEYHEQVNAASAAAYSGKGAVTFLEAPIRTKDGKTRWIQWHGTTLRDATGKVVGLATLGVDLTEHKALQEQYLQVPENWTALGRLAGGVAHDFNNLLTVINGYSDIFLGDRGKDDRPAQRH